MGRLADVQWQEAGTFYNATATYTGTASGRSVTEYTVTVEYSGEVNTIILTTALGTRTYAVTGVMKVGVMDNSMLAATSDNCITLFTCVENQPDYRWCVRAVEI